MKGRVGIVGLGIMGGAIARNLLGAGWQVQGFDTDARQCTDLASAGVTVAPTVTALVQATPCVLLSLPNATAVYETAEAIAASGVTRRVIIEASTLALADKMKAQAVLAAAGHIVLDCPISGTGAQAERKDLVVYASGDSAAISAAQCLFADFSRQAHDVGSFGNGTRMKLVANLLVAIHNVASAEAMVLGMKAGLDPHQVLELVAAGAATSRIFELRAPMMAENRYLPATMKMDIWQKDLRIISQFAAEISCPVPMFSSTIPLYAAAMATGHSADDTASVCAVLETLAGLHRA